MHHAHVFLGPSLDLTTAQKIFPYAYYHPPIQCGDIIRLLRLNPTLIVIIDGLYETTPAVWHKEILLAIETGIAVWGAASMGALRASELHQFGMQGFGDIFSAYKEGEFIDDDEVAVLHLEEDKQFTPINDAMVNIRATCEKAYHENIISLKTQNTLMAYCKEQFYPYRSLVKAIQHLATAECEEYTHLSQWLEQYGMIDVKRNDTISTLKHLSSQPSLSSNTQKSRLPTSQSMTCFLRDLIIYANTTPFKHKANWLPDIEKAIYEKHQQSPMSYMLTAEITSFMQKLIVFSSADKCNIENAALMQYIKSNQLYSPAKDFIFYKDHLILSDIYDLICQSICLLNLTVQQLDNYLPALIHYYDLPPEIADHSKKALRIILVLIFTIHQHISTPHLRLSKNHVKHHLKQIKGWRRYTSQQFKNWLTHAPSHFTTLLHIYLMAFSVHALSEIKIDYYLWLHDVYSILQED